MRFRQHFYLLCIFMIWLTFLPAIGLANQMNVLELDDLTDAQEASGWLTFYEDQLGNKVIADIEGLDESRWVNHPSITPNFSYTQSVYWFRLKLTNQGVTQLNGLLEVGNPLLGEIEFYFVLDGEITNYDVSGSRYPYNNRSISHRNFLFSFSLPSNAQGVAYLRVASESSLQVPIRVGSEFKYFEYDQADLMMKSAYYGMMFIIILFNLFIYISLREPVYLFYVAFIFGFLVQQISMHGFVTAHIWPQYPKAQEIMVFFFMPFTMFFALLFTRRFLNLPFNAPRLDRVFYVYQLITLVIAAAVFLLSYEIVGQTVAAAAIFVSLNCLLVGPYIWYKGHSIARFYSLAWVCVTVGSGLLALNKLALIPRTTLTENGILFGSAAEAILLSLALADRLNIERRKRRLAQENELKESEIRKQAEERLIHSALHNGTTDFPNRLYFERWFDRNLNHDIPTHYVFGLLHLNRFHEINQTLGHGLADGLFCRVTQKLNAHMLAHDEFVEFERYEYRSYKIAIVEGVYLGFLLDTDKLETVRATMNKLLSCLDEPMEFQQMFIDVGASIGWTSNQDEYYEGAELIRNALIAVDVGGTRNHPVMEYHSEINPYSARRLSLAGDLRKALEDEGLQLYFQPQLGVKNQQYVCMEALIRWFHADYGFIPPDEFIPIAEQSGIIKLLTNWVVDHSLMRVAELEKQGIKLSVAVNISAVNLRDKQLANMIQTRLEQHNVSASQLVLEVTETAMMDDPELALHVLTTIAELGVRISIDDFGTGHSSLAYIKRLPANEIKIDRSFVLDMERSKDDEIIVRTTVNMCHDLGLEVVAEGVETDQAVDRLTSMGCNYLQGYGLCRPIPFDDVVVFLKKQC